MRIKLYFTLEKETIPIDYRRSIISFIKMSLSEEKWMTQYIDRKQFLRIDIRLQWTENLKIQ